MNNLPPYFPKSIKWYFFLLVFSFSASIVVAQDVSVVKLPLSRVQGYGPFGPNTTMTYSDADDYSRFMHIPEALDTFLIRELDLQPLQRKYQEYLAGSITEEEFLRMTGNNLDSSHYSRVPIKQSVSILVGLRAETKIVIVDGNRNYDFGDDQVFTFDTMVAEAERIAFMSGEMGQVLRYRDSLPNTLANFEYFYRGKVISSDILLKINPFNSMVRHKDPFIKKLSVYPELYEYRYGEFLIRDSIKLKVALHPSYPTATYTNFGSMLVLAKYGKPFVSVSENPRDILRIGDTWYLDSIAIQLVQVSPLGDSLTLHVSRIKGKSVGPEIGQLVPEIMRDDIWGRRFDLKAESENNYLLLDFWGTWCKPCVAAMPKLRSFHQAHKDQGWTLVGVAVDVDLETVTNFVQKNDMTWTQLFMDQNNQENWKFMNEFKVRGYPTYILIAPGGEILARGGSEELDDILKSLMSKLSEK